jgi:hypothetical protein
MESFKIILSAMIRSGNWLMLSLFGLVAFAFAAFVVIWIVYAGDGKMAIPFVGATWIYFLGWFLVTTRVAEDRTSELWLVPFMIGAISIALACLYRWAL